MLYSPRVLDAFALMYEWHKDQTRKAKNAPYIAHLLAVAGVVGEYGGDEDQFIAAMLHDAVEDQGGERVLLAIRDRFGPRVADCVAACSDAFGEPKPPWRERKEAHIAKLRQADARVKLVAAADKLHNCRALIADLRAHGPDVFERFQGKREGTLWYYRACHDAIADAWDHGILHELREAVEILEEVAA